MDSQKRIVEGRRIKTRRSIVLNIGDDATIIQKISGKEHSIKGKVVSFYRDRIVVETSNGHQWAVKTDQLKESKQ